MYLLCQKKKHLENPSIPVQNHQFTLLFWTPFKNNYQGSNNTANVPELLHLNVHFKKISVINTSAFH